MTSTIHYFTRIATPSVLLVGLAMSLPPTAGDALAQSGNKVTGGAYALAVDGQASVTATLPAGGGQVSDELMSASLAEVSTGLLTALSTGAAQGFGANAQSIASAADVSILGGLIVASRVLSIASSFAGKGYRFSDADGSQFDGLAIAGVPYDAPVAPNTRVDLPGVGYVLLNAQSTSGHEITVTGLRVVLTDGSGGVIGEIVVASASAGAW